MFVLQLTSTPLPIHRDSDVAWSMLPVAVRLEPSAWPACARRIDRVQMLFLLTKAY
jgi:hypothetical protein